MKGFEMESTAETQFLIPNVSRRKQKRTRWTCMAGALLGVFAVITCILVGSMFSSRTAEATDKSSSGGETAAKIISSQSRQAEPVVHRSRHGSYSHGAVASDADLCSKIGVEFLRDKGGSAVDAALATLICVGVANAHSTGIAGGHFVVIYDTPRNVTQKEMVALDSWITAPLSSHEHMYDANPAAKETGPLSIAVPGEVNGYWWTWQRFGKVAWKDLFQPTIRMCRDGFPMGRALSDAVAEYRQTILADPGLREVFAKADGTLYREGETIKRSKLAVSLEKIAAEGPDVFYKGSLAADIVADIQDLGGMLTLEDLRQHKPIWRKPIHKHLSNGNYHLFGMEPPSSAILVQFVLDVLNGYNYTPASVTTADEYVLFLHRVVEAWKIGWSSWMNLGDPDFANEDAKSWMERMLSVDFAQEARRLIRDDTAQDYGSYSPSPSPSDRRDGRNGHSETTHLSVYAPDGSSVALTSTIESFFGCGKRGLRTGIIFNNLMKLFSLPEETNRPANHIAPNKRPQASMSPSLVLDEKQNVVFNFGGSGFHRIVTAICLVSSKFLFLGKNVTDAVNEARIHYETPPDVSLYYDEFMPQDIMDGLRQKGHTKQEPTLKYFPYLATVQAIDSRECSQCAPSCAQPCIHAVSDFRKHGAPDGF